MQPPPLAVPVRYFPVLFAGICAVGLLLCALLASRLHFHNLLVNHCSPELSLAQELSFRNWRFDHDFWISVSSTIGDKMPERSIWRTAIALATLCFVPAYYHLLQFYRRFEMDETSQRLLAALPALGVCKIISAYGYSFIGSQEMNTAHTVSFAAYIIVGSAIQVIVMRLSQKQKASIYRHRLSFRIKAMCFALQVGAVCGVAYFFIDHLSNCTPGAYSKLTLFEWVFVVGNLGFDGSWYFELHDSVMILNSNAGPPKSLGWATSRPSSAVLWSAEIGLAYLFVSSFLQMVQQVYFMPMVAMKFTAEVGLALTPPVVVLAICRHPKAMRLLKGDIHVRELLRGQLALTVFACSAAACLLHIDVTVRPGLKIIIAAIGPHVLWAFTHLRFVLMAGKARATGFEISGGHEIHRAVVAMPLGFGLSMIVRWAGISQDLFQANALWNAIGILVFVFVVVWGPIQSLSCDIAECPADLTTTVSPTGNRVSACAVGLLFGLLITTASAPGTLARYVGIDPSDSLWAPLGSILALLAGVYLSRMINTTSRFQALAGVSVVSMAGLYYGTTQSNRHFPVKSDALEEWTIESFSGSPTVAVFSGFVVVASLGAWLPHSALSAFGCAAEFAFGPDAPPHAKSSHEASPAATAAIGYAAMVSLIVAEVYTVCYPFVPGGALLRDRLGVVLIGGVCLFVLLSLTQQRPTIKSTKHGAPPTSCVTLGIVTALVLGYRAVTFTEVPPEAVTTDSRVVNVTSAIWTIHFGVDDYGVDSMDRLAQRISDTNASVVGILESDMQRITNGNRDVIEYMAYHLGFRYSDFGPTTLDSTFGCALLSRYPIAYVRRHVLPSPMGELGCLVQAKLQLHEGFPLLNVYVGHWGNTEHVQDLVLQSEALASLALANPGPSIFLGYLTTHVGYKNYYRMVQTDGEEEDELVRWRGDENTHVVDDGTKILPTAEHGFPIPKIPIRKRPQGLFRDAARDTLRTGEAGSNPHEHAAARNTDTLHHPFPRSYRWTVHALVEPTQHGQFIEGRHLTIADYHRTAAARRMSALESHLASHWPAEGDPIVEPAASKSLERLQKAAEILAQRMTRNLDVSKIVSEVPEPLRPAMKYLTNYTKDGITDAMLFVHKSTNRATRYHPRREYEDRYCQQVLYRDAQLVDWYRILEIDELSDTELQVLKLGVTMDP